MIGIRVLLFRALRVGLRFPIGAAPVCTLVVSFASSVDAGSADPFGHTSNCWKAEVVFTNQEALSEMSGIPNYNYQSWLGRDLRADDFSNHGEDLCIQYLDGHRIGMKQNLGDMFPQLCHFVREEGISAYAVLFLEERWSMDFGRRQGINLEIACGHEIVNRDVLE